MSIIVDGSKPERLKWPDDFVNKVIHGDCLEVMKQIPDGAVDLVVTSPPYLQQRDYGNVQGGWTELMVGAFESFGESGKEDAQIIVNLGQIHRDGSVLLYWNDWLDWMQTQWRFFGQYVWDQGDGLPGNWNGRLAPSHEYLFHFNRQSRQPHKWIKAKGEKRGGTGLRGKDSKTRALSSPHKCGQPFKIPDSVVRVYREMSRQAVLNDHPARFPIGLPAHIIQSYSQGGDIILDPFLGSGTTAVAAKQLGRKYCGIEINREYCEIAEDRLRQEELF
jgi:DNA modification methylase